MPATALYTVYTHLVGQVGDALHEQQLDGAHPALLDEQIACLQCNTVVRALK